VDKHYVYGCDNCIISDFLQIGKHKLLFDFSKISNRKLILLDSQNLVVDALVVEAPMTMCVRDEKEFLVPDLNYTARIKIVENQFQVKTLYQIHTSLGMRNRIIYKGYLIGMESISCESEPYAQRLGFIDLRDTFKIFLSKQSKFIPHYRKKGKDTMLILSRKNLLEKGTVNDNLIFQPVVNIQCEESSRRKDAPGLHSYAIDENRLMYFNYQSQKLYYIDIEPTPRLVGDITLPLDLDEKGGWHHFYDNLQHTSYFVYEKVSLEEKKKGEKEKSPQEYFLYRLDGKELKKISDLNYLPTDIEDGKVYELRGSNKSYRIYGHPFVEPKYLERIFLNTN
jgi:hypothetical protein